MGFSGRKVTTTVETSFTNVLEVGKRCGTTNSTNEEQLEINKKEINTMDQDLCIKTIAFHQRDHS